MLIPYTLSTLFTLVLYGALSPPYALEAVSGAIRDAQTATWSNVMNQLDPVTILLAAALRLGSVLVVSETIFWMAKEKTGKAPQPRNGRGIQPLKKSLTPMPCQ